MKSKILVVDDEEHIALSAFGMSYEREYTSITVIGIDPFEAFWIAVVFVETFIIFIKMK